MQLALAVGGEALGKARVGLTGGPDHQEPVLPGHQVGAGAKDHPLEGLPGPLQGEHLALHRLDGQLGHQLAAPGATGEYGPLAVEQVLLALRRLQPHAVEGAIGVPPQGVHLGSLLELHPQGGAGPLQGSHQLPPVVDLAVLAKQQPGGPGRTHAGHLPLQAHPIEPIAKAGGGIGIPIGC